MGHKLLDNWEAMKHVSIAGSLSDDKPRRADSFRGVSVNLGTIQRILPWPHAQGWHAELQKRITCVIGFGRPTVKHKQHAPGFQNFFF